MVKKARPPVLAEAEEVVEKKEAEIENSESDEGGEKGGDSKSKKKRERRKKKATVVGNEGSVSSKPSEAKSKEKPKKQSIHARMILQRMQEAEAEAERVRKLQEEEKKRQEEERQKELERLRLEQERKERKRQKEKERKQRLKNEGKLLTKTQKEKKAKMNAMLQQMAESGATFPQIPKPGEHVVGGKPKPFIKKRKMNKVQEEQQSQEGLSNVIATTAVETPCTSNEIEEKNDSKPDTVSDDTGSHASKINFEPTWEDMLSEYKECVDMDKAMEMKALNNLKVNETTNRQQYSKGESHISDPALRIKLRQKESKKSATTDRLRSPIICVMGHVDTGKTKLLDKLRNTNVQDGEAGGITQQIGVTNVPLVEIKKVAGFLPDINNFDFKISGLSIIDTPGHFSFRNLRSLGSSLSDMAVLIVDIMHGIQMQTEDSIKLLLSKKAPFVIALNKIDLIVDWKCIPGKSIKEILDLQSVRAKQHFDVQFKSTFTQFAERGLNIALYFENKDPSNFISVVPTSARTGDGIPDLIAYICKYSQERLSKRLAISTGFDATVMEVKIIPGLGPTIDVILINGTISQGDRIVLAGLEGPVVSQVRALLTPHPMKEMRVKGSYIHHDKISTSQGIKIAGPNLELALAGFPIYIAEHEDEVDIFKSKISDFINNALNSFEKKEKGVYVQASTLGSLEALLDYLRQSQIPYFGINIGPVHKRDVINAMSMLEHSPIYAVILAFDVKIDSDVQQFAEKSGVKIFSANIIYHLHDQYVEYVKEYRRKKGEELKHAAVFPCTLKILPEHIFKTRDPIVVGVMIESGSARIGTPLCVTSRENLTVGTIASIECNHKPLEVAKKGQEVCIKIVPTGDDAPKMLGRHFMETDLLVSKITRESIDILKEYFRDQVSNAEWILIKELKPIFNII